MNILWIIEGNSRSANYKIPCKLINYVNANKSFVGLYSANRYIDDGCDFKKCSSINFIGSFTSEVLANLRSNKEWSQGTKQAKVRYLLRHPIAMIEMLKKYIFKSNFICVKQLKQICLNNNIDVIIGTVFPYEIANIISDADIKAKKIVLQLDPYVNNYTFRKNRIANRVIEEKNVLDSIDALLTTNIIKNEIYNTHESVKAKVIEIEFPEIEAIVTTEDGACQTHLLKKKENDVLLLHAGTLYEDIRNPRYLVDLLIGLPNNYKLVIVGSNTSMIKSYDEPVRNRIIDLGFVDQNIAAQLREETDVLVCFNNAIDNQVPSKLFEYIATGKPFINFCQLKNCPSLPYVEGYSNALNVFVDDIKFNEIVDFVEYHKGIKIDREIILQRYYKHTYEYVAKQIEEVISNVSI